MFLINFNHIQIKFQLFFRNFIKYTRNNLMFQNSNKVPFNNIKENYWNLEQSIKINYFRTNSLSSKNLD